MRTWLLRLCLPLPIVISMAFAPEVKAQGGPGVFVGVGTGWGGPWGPGWGPGWRGWGPGWGWPGWGFPFMAPFDSGFYSNGLSAYGPPVPTYRPIPGVFGGGDSRFFPVPPLMMPPYGGPGWMNMYRLPITKTDLALAEGRPYPFQIRSPSLQFEIKLPTESARVFVADVEQVGIGHTRFFVSPPLENREWHTYDVRAEWFSEEGKVTLTKRVMGRAGDQVEVVFK